MKLLFFLVLLCATASAFAAPTVYNIRDYGATTGQKANNATGGIAKAIAAAKAAGGGVV